MNQQSQPEELRSSEIKQHEGRYPSQIVLRCLKPKTYATHIKIHQPEGTTYFILGRYFFSLEEAQADFQKRVMELEGP